MTVSLSDYYQLDPIARGQLFKLIKEKENLSFQKIAKKIGKSAPFVVNSVRLLELPEAIKDGVWGGLISEGHARSLLRINDINECIEIYKIVLKTHASVRETEELVRRKVKDKPQTLDEEKVKKILEYLEKVFRKKFGKITVKERKTGVRIILEEKS